jgi:hypothetical protein
VQLVEVVIADQVRPQSSVGGPAGFVDENGHPTSLGPDTPEGAFCHSVRHPVK